LVKGRKQVDAIVRERLGAKKPTAIEQAEKLIRKMTNLERAKLWALVGELFA
jgi:hypothetical protein